MNRDNSLADPSPVARLERIGAYCLYASYLLLT